MFGLYTLYAYMHATKQTRTVYAVLRSLYCFIHSGRFRWIKQHEVSVLCVYLQTPAQTFLLLIPLEHIQRHLQLMCYRGQKLLTYFTYLQKRELFLCHCTEMYWGRIHAARTSMVCSVARQILNLPVRWKTDLKPMPKCPTLSGSLCLMLWDSILIPRQSSSSNRPLLYAYRAGPWSVTHTQTDRPTDIYTSR